MTEKRVRPAAPIYLAGAVWIICGLILPLYTVWGILAAAAVSAAVFLIGTKLMPGKIVLVKEPEKPVETGNKELDQTLESAKRELDALRGVKTQLTSPDLMKQTDRMIRAGEAIFREIAQKPEKAPMIRRFAEYYLPQVSKIFVSYGKMKKLGTAGENTSELVRSVETNAEMMAQAFEKQLDSLYLDEMLDITTDITVLEHMMKGDGLTDEAVK